MQAKIRLHIKHKLHQRFNLGTDELQEKFLKLKRVWGGEEKKIVNGLEKITGLHFKKNYMDVYLINPDGRPSISSPTIVKIQDNEYDTIRIIVHELIHNLMWDNKEEADWSVAVQKLFNRENKKTAIHISVHAILEALYIDTLEKPDEIIKDVEECQKRPDYSRAWEIVKKEGYKNIIKKLKDCK